MSWPEIEYTDIAELRGPLAVVRGVRDACYDDVASILLGTGERRHGMVLEVDREAAVVQVLEGTAGITQTDCAVSFAGEPMRIPVGDAWLGRTCNGRGEPIDGGPPILAGQRAAVAGAPMNPTWRRPPAEPVLTGVSAIDALTTLVRGQKLPVFAEAGLPYLELATQLAAQANVAGEPFSVIFAGMGLTHADAAFVRDALDERAAAGQLVLLLNTADDPVIERILTPRVALTVAEDLAYRGGRHVLVVMTDMTSYAEALREVSAARNEIPARRAYPGYLYSDLASLYERCGRMRDNAGSVTVVPILTMPAGDITHPVPDLTGYITEGQLVLSTEVHARGVYPPLDVLSSLSRLMRKGAGPGRTREDHLPLAAQSLAALARVGGTGRAERDRSAVPDVRRDLRTRPARPAAGRVPRPRRHPRPGLARAPGAAPPGADHVAGTAARTAPRRWVSTMPMLGRLPPGRAGALWLRHRLAAATRGTGLLQQKLVILTQEAQRLRLLHDTTLADWRQADRTARQWLLRAALLGGQQPIRFAAQGPAARLTLHWSTVMGLRYPAEPSVDVPEVPPAARTPGGMALLPATTAYRDAFRAAARHAAVAAALRGVEAEAAATRQRVRALERHWIPRLRAAEAALKLQMAELEDADAVRRRRAAAALAAARSGGREA